MEQPLSSPSSLFCSLSHAAFGFLYVFYCWLKSNFNTFCLKWLNYSVSVCLSWDAVATCQKQLIDNRTVIFTVLEVGKSEMKALGKSAGKSKVCFRDYGLQGMRSSLGLRHVGISAIMMAQPSWPSESPKAPHHNITFRIRIATCDAQEGHRHSMCYTVFLKNIWNVMCTW